ncbi:MAG: sulfoxide reductase heme-binding subunit YedZ [Chromatiales bacterium]|nr:MAG: sulfoxide reductase heme-binding subunit YedZ [Chromatiales bacterium]
MPTTRQVRFVLKPFVFAACAAPLVYIALRIAGIGPSLGPNPVEVLQDEFGEWALRMLLATLAITPLRVALGKPWPLRFRRMLGLFAFTYAALHFANYLVLDQQFDWPIIVEDILDRPFITVGFTALLILLPLAVTSTQGWQRRLGARWGRLHRVVYVAAILACWHFWWQVKKDITEPAIYAAILGVLLGIRVWRELKKGPGRPTAGGETMAQDSH